MMKAHIYALCLVMLFLLSGVAGADTPEKKTFVRDAGSYWEVQGEHICDVEEPVHYHYLYFKEEPHIFDIGYVTIEEVAGDVCVVPRREVIIHNYRGRYRVEGTGRTVVDLERWSMETQVDGYITNYAEAPADFDFLLMDYVHRPMSPEYMAPTDDPRSEDVIRIHAVLVPETMADGECLLQEYRFVRSGMPADKIALKIHLLQTLFGDTLPKLASLGRDYRYSFFEIDETHPLYEELSEGISSRFGQDFYGGTAVLIYDEDGSTPIDLVIVDLFGENVYEVMLEDYDFIRLEDVVTVDRLRYVYSVYREL